MASRFVEALATIAARLHRARGYLVVVAQEERVRDAQHESGRFYTVFVDEVEHRFDHSPVTGGEIMDRAGIPHSDGLLLINDDNTQQTVGVNEEIELKPGRRFKKAPRFKRG